MRFIQQWMIITIVLYQKVQLDDPTLYEYYTAGGIESGLNDNGEQFQLNGKPFVIYSGSFHYFRVVPQRWRSVLERFKAAGLNAVQMYIPWNIHEDIPDQFDFESTHLNLDRFLREVKRADMFAIIRPGPYICAEWEMGGLPSWLLRNTNMTFREYDPLFMDRVNRYWNRVMAIINRHQFTPNGGPVIMVQIENEYYGAPIPHSQPYLRWLIKITLDSGFRQLIFTSDNIDIAINDPVRTIPALLETANLNNNSYEKLLQLRKAQPNKPIYVSEFWPGWFDSWGDSQHNRYSPQMFREQATDILFRINGSINYYVFIGGTNFGFMNGALRGINWTRVVTSYDYDAPLSEAGNYTEKYWETRILYDKMVSSRRMPKILVPSQPPPVQKAFAYGMIPIDSYYTFESLLTNAQRWNNISKPVSMEMLNVGHNYGQRFGFVLYRIHTPPVRKYDILGPIADRGILLVDGNQTAVLEDADNFTISLGPFDWNPNRQWNDHYIDMLVENQGRANWGKLELPSLSRKGIDSPIQLDNEDFNLNLTIYSLDFNQTYISMYNQDEQLSNSIKEPFSQRKFIQPRLYNTHLYIEGEPMDTYLLLPGWTKGNVFVNGFNIGRYWKLGPQKTLYIPGPLLRQGHNKINVFELHQPGEMLQFVDKPILE